MKDRSPNNPLTDKEDYDFDVYCQDEGAIYVLVLAGKNLDPATGLPKPSFSDKESDITTFYYYISLTQDIITGKLKFSNGSVRPWWPKDKETCYPLLANPHIDFASFTLKEVEGSMPNYDELCGTFDGFDESGKRAGYNIFAIYGECYGVPSLDGYTKKPIFSKENSVKGPWKASEAYPRIVLHSSRVNAESLSGKLKPETPCLGWVGVSEPAGDAKGDNYLEYFDYDMNNATTPKSYVLDQGDIGALEIEDNRQVIYYTKA